MVYLLESESGLMSGCKSSAFSCTNCLDKHNMCTTMESVFNDRNNNFEDEVADIQNMQNITDRTGNNNKLLDNVDLVLTSSGGQFSITLQQVIGR